MNYEISAQAQEFRQNNAKLRFDFDAYPMHSPFGFVHLMHQNLSARALFGLNSLAYVNVVNHNFLKKYRTVYNQSMNLHNDFESDKTSKACLQFPFTLTDNNSSSTEKHITPYCINEYLNLHHRRH